MASIIKSIPLSGRTFSLGTEKAPTLSATELHKQKSVQAAASKIEDGSSEHAAPYKPPSQSAEQAQAAVMASSRDVDREIATRVSEALAMRKAELEQALALEAQEVKRQAQQDGYDAGLLEAEERMERDRKDRAHHIDELRKAIETEVARVFLSVEELSAELALAALRKILGEAVPSGDTVKSVVTEQLRRLNDAGPVSVRLHPDDFTLFNGSYDDASKLDSARVRFQADSSVGRGGCILETERGIFDARLETQLDAFVTALRGTSSTHPEALP